MNHPALFAIINKSSLIYRQRSQKLFLLDKLCSMHDFGNDRSFYKRKNTQSLRNYQRAANSTCRTMTVCQKSYYFRICHGSKPSKVNFTETELVRWSSPDARACSQRLLPAQPVICSK